MIKIKDDDDKDDDGTSDPLLKRFPSELPRCLGRPMSRPRGFAWDPILGPERSFWLLTTRWERLECQCHRSNDSDDGKYDDDDEDGKYDDGDGDGGEYDDDDGKYNDDDDDGDGGEYDGDDGKWWWWWWRW